MPRKTQARDAGVGCAGSASMRPRPDAAENGPGRLPERVLFLGFNEAAARCRGKLNSPGGHAGDRTRFNEAAARCRGKRLRDGRRSGPLLRFNEAAARCRGKP